MNVYVVQGHDGRNQWIERLFSNKKEALAHAAGLAGEWFLDRNHRDEPDLRLFDPVVCGDGSIHYGYGYSEEHPEPLVSVETEKLYGAPLVALAEQAE